MINFGVDDFSFQAIKRFWPRSKISKCHKDCRNVWANSWVGLQTNFCLLTPSSTSCWSLCRGRPLKHYNQAHIHFVPFCAMWRYIYIYIYIYIWSALNEVTQNLWTYNIAISKALVHQLYSYGETIFISSQGTEQVNAKSCMVFPPS